MSAERGARPARAAGTVESSESAAPSEEPAPRGARSISEGWRSLPLAWRRAVVTALVLRTVLAFASLTLGGMLEDRGPVDVVPVAGTSFAGREALSSQEQGAGLLVGSLERFDALWYLAIAEHGYPERLTGEPLPGAVAFFPLFPLLVGTIGRLFGANFLLAANVVALFATVAAFAGIHRLVEEETGDLDLARRAVTTAAVFPASFFLLAPYTESVFLALTAWALVWALRGGWGWATVLAAAAALTRNLGVLLSLPLALEAWRQAREGAWRPLGWMAGAAGAPAGVGLFLGFAWLRYGDPLAPVAAQVAWQREWTSPLTTLADATRIGMGTPGLFPSGYHAMDLLVFVPVLLAVVWLLWRTPLPYGVYAAAHVLLWLVYPFPGRPLMSTYRFAIAVVPLTWAFAAWTRSPRVATVWNSVSAALLGVLLLLYVNWYFIF